MSLTTAFAQTRPLDGPQSDASTGQSSSGETSQAQLGSVVTPDQSRGTIHIVPFGRGDAGLKNGAAPAGAHLTYFGGPVISNIHVVAVFWGPTVNSAVTGGIGQFFTDITSSNYYDLLSEYSTAGITSSGGASSNQSLVRGQFDGAITITPSSACPTTCTITDNQIQAELATQIASGHLPQPLSDLQGIIKTFYMIYFPPGVTIDAGGGALSCVVFCAYHSNTNNASPSLRMPYGVLPDFAPPSACSRGCGQGSLFQNVTAVTSHEMAEAATDAQVGSSTVNNGPPLAWYDPSPPPTPDLGEIGDICNGQDTLVSAGGNTYAVQQEFSNLQNDCVSAPPIFNLAVPATVAQGAPVSVPLTVKSSVTSAALAGYLGTVHFTSSDATAVLPSDYTFIAADAGTHGFSVTLSTSGNQTITATDTHSTGFNGTAIVTVNTTPDLVISKIHAGNFIVGQPGTYTITVSNAGNGPTTGTVTVVDSLPTGLAATAISGTGWTCNLGTVTCNRADALGRASSYPAISLVVNASGVAPTRVTNTVTVSGGGETNTANDSATDLTDISAPDLTVAIAPGIFFQGAIGASYVIFPGNSGDLPTVGTVTVKDTVSAGLTPTAISGVGWNCTLADLTCTRADSLPASTPFPVIQLTVDVAGNAPSTVTNVVTISGGGESNTANDTAQDVSAVGPPRVPDLTVSLSHAANFLQGLPGTYTVQVSNVGLGASSGTVSVSASLPSSLTATSLAGPGWTCTLGTLTCTRSDIIGGGLFSNTIILNVNVAANAPATVTATASVSGGGDTNAANNTANDVTQIVPAVVDLQTSLFSPSGTYNQGQTGGSYLAVVANQGNVPSSGVVTVTNTLSAGLTATAISGPGWNCTLTSLTCTRTDALAVAQGFAAITVVFNVANDAPANSSATVTVSGGGDSSPANNTSFFSAQITPGIAITLNGPSSATVSAGAPAAYNLSLNLGPAAGTVTFGCTGLPTGAACSFNPPSITSSGAEVVTISTTARSLSIPISSRFPIGGNPLAALLLLGFAGFLASRLTKPALRRRLAFASGTLILLCVMGACGGGGGTPTPSPTPTPTPNGTAAGTYPITVTATGASSPATQQLTLVVR
ncbi:MAG TPA: hypothetical protein VN872_02010 [Candidatus Acidoferrum sp.]|nr:hypothetical protein [Candidatus Acidoferrum sp.]